MLIVGCGALGCAVADSLCRAGVGSITIVDRDIVELTNLQRQILFTEQHAEQGAPKAVAAADRLAEINSSVQLRPIVADFTARNAGGIVNRAEPHLLLDGTDNFEARLLINDLACDRHLPYAYAGVVATGGVAMLIKPGETACLRCMVPEPPPPGVMPTCDTAGVLGPAVAVAAGLEASLAIRWLAGDASVVDGQLIEFDLWPMAFRTLDASALRRDDCACCVRGDYAYMRGEVGSDAVALCGQLAVQVASSAAGDRAIDLTGLAQRLAVHGEFSVTPFMLRGELPAEPADDAGCCSITVFSDGRAIIKGTSHPDRARAIYARYIGS